MPAVRVPTVPSDPPTDVPAVDAWQPLGVAEIAVLAGVERTTVSKWRQRHVLPPPCWQIGNRDLWPRWQIDAWLAGRRATR